MEKIIAKIAALGVPGLILMTAIGATGYAGGAAITAALSALGPGGILGGIATLGVIALITDAITEFGFDAVYSAVIKELVKRGETKESILAKIDKYPVTRNLKLKLKDQINNAFANGNA